MSNYLGGDDELIERLRRTLKTEAAAVRPNPEEQLSGRYQPAGRVIPFRPRWPRALIAVAAAAAIAVAVLEWPGGSSRPVRVLTPITSPGSVVQTPAPTTVTRPNGGGAGPTAPTSPTTWAPVPVPAAFTAQSVTFVSWQRGWVLGTVPCGSSSCLSMATTDDAGHTWSAVRAPVAAVPRFVTLSVRFANGVDGWVYLNSPNAGPAQLWSTHDGGAVWRPVHLAALTGPIAALEVSGGTAHLAVVGTNAYLDLLSAPVGSDDWISSPAQLPLGGGPVPSSELVLQRDHGWLLQDDRTVIGGAQLNSSGQWQTWAPPCAKANGVAVLAASDPSNLAAICDEGVWGPSDQPGARPRSQWLFVSSDGGASFHSAGSLPNGYQVGSAITTSAPNTVVAGATAQTSSSGPQGAVLIATFDGGHTWRSVYAAESNVSSWVDVGFTDLLQGVAIGVGQDGTSLIMTRNGGHTWAPVDFGATP